MQEELHREETQEPQEEVRPSYYAAAIRMEVRIGTLTITPKKKPPWEMLVLLRGEKRLRFPFSKTALRWARRFKEAGTEQVKAVVWPRTDPKGRVNPKASMVGKLYPVSEGFEEGFVAQGRLVEVNPERGFLVLEVRGNPEGRLKEAFRLAVWASPEVLEGLPPVGSGVHLKGEYIEKARKLVAWKVEPVALWDD
jgi:hypothetical protein